MIFLVKQQPESKGEIWKEKNYLEIGREVLEERETGVTAMWCEIWGRSGGKTTF